MQDSEGIARRPTGVSPENPKLDKRSAISQDSQDSASGILATKFQVTPISEWQAQTISAWAISTGRPVSSLCAYLLDQAFTTALEQGRIPASVLELVERQFEEERELARLEVELASLKARNSNFLSIQARIALVKGEIEEEKTAKDNALKKGKK